MGVTVFILDGYDLPDEISADYNDGFDYISSKLYEDIGTGIKLLKSSSVSISKELAESESDESNESIIAKFDAEDKDTVYFVNSSADKEILKEKGYDFYIDSPTNQIFVEMEDEKLKELEKNVRVSVWEKTDEKHTVVRFATSWATDMEKVEKLREYL